MMYLGDFAAGATVSFKWNTFSTTGASITRATDGTIKIYKDASGVERTSANGVTDTEDFDSRTGVHLCSIDLSDNTDAGFYAAAHDYSVYITAATIDGQVVNAVLAHFSIQNRYSTVTVGTNNDKTGYALSAAGSAALTEGYATDGSTATLPQLLYMIWAILAESNISGTTNTVKKLDGTTTAMTLTLDSATAPTTITRAT